MASPSRRLLPSLLLAACGCSLSTAGLDPTDGDDHAQPPDDGTGHLLVDSAPDADADTPADSPPEADADAAADTTSPCDPTDCTARCVDVGFTGGYCEGPNCYCTGGADADADADDDAGAHEDSTADVGPPCPTPVGHDEDGDTLDDACDRCPTWFDPDQRDTDGDGLGDACEAPATPALLHRLEAFDSFSPSPLAPMTLWLTDGGTWVPSPDVVTGSSSPYGNNRWLDTSTTSPYAVEATFRFIAAPLGDPNYTAVLFGIRPAATTYYWWGCFLEWDSRTLSLWQYDGGDYVNRIALNSTPLEPDERSRETVRRLRATWDGTSLRCTFDNANGDHGELTYGVPAIARIALDGAPGFRVFNETAEFRSFVLYR